MKEIKIRLYTPRELWMKYLDRLQHDADKMTDANREAVSLFKNAVLHHISREPIPRENKEYLNRVVMEEYEKIRLFPVWPRPKSKKEKR